MKRREFLKLTGLLGTLVVLNPTKASAIVGEPLETPFDVEIWGQKALAPRSEVLERINVRTIINEIEKSIEHIVKSHTWKRQNSAYARKIVRERLDEYLNMVKAKQALHDYAVVCDRTNNTIQHELDGVFVADVYLQPMKTIEQITLNCVVSNQQGV